jgi:hypothetical protein
MMEPAMVRDMKEYAESFVDQAHLAAIVAEARAIVDHAPGSA